MPIPDFIMSPFHNATAISRSTLFWFINLAVSVCVPIHLIIICVLWLVFTAFSSIAISTVNHADSRASLASLDSNPSTNEKSSEKTDNCEKVRCHSQNYLASPESKNISDSYSVLIGSLIPRSHDPCL